MNFNETGVVKAICISPARGTEKHTISEGHFIPNFGMRAMPTRERGIGR